MSKKIILITGASSGIGKACAGYLDSQGHVVYGASRNPTAECGIPLRMDVDDDESVVAAVREVVAREGRIDVVVNSAGFGISGAIEDTSIEEAKSQFETNFFGVVRVLRAVLPSMRTRTAGLIVNVSSIAGLISIPFQAYYAASKFALEGLSEALRVELIPFGVRVVLIEPGDFKTGFTVNRRRAAAAVESSSYHRYCQRALAVMENDERNGPEPGSIAVLVGRLIDDPSPRLRYSVGLASQRLMIPLKAVIPARLAEWLMVRYFKLNDA